MTARSQLRERNGESFKHGRFLVEGEGFVKFEKNWAILGMTVCLLLNILSNIDVFPIESLKMSSLGGVVFFSSSLFCN